MWAASTVTTNTIALAVPLPQRGRLQHDRELDEHEEVEGRGLAGQALAGQPRHDHEGGIVGEREHGLEGEVGERRHLQAVWHAASARNPHAFRRRRRPRDVRAGYARGMGAFSAAARA